MRRVAPHPTQGIVYPKIRIGVKKMRDRKKDRENRRLKHWKEKLEKRSETGYKDLTPYNAALQIKTNGKANIVLK